MGLVKVVANRRRKASAKVEYVMPYMYDGFTNDGYFEWLLELIKNPHLVYKTSAWYKGCVIHSTVDNSTVELGLTGKPFSQYSEAVHSRLSRSKYYAVVPLTDSEYQAVSKGRGVTASYGGVIMSCAGWLYTTNVKWKETDYGSIGDVIRAYMKDAGCRATKYAICETDYSGLYSVSVLGTDARAFFDFLHTKRGRPFLGRVSEEFKGELDECDSKFLFAYSSPGDEDFLGEGYAVFNGSVLGNSKFAITKKMFGEKMPHVVDVSSGKPEAIWLNL